MSIITFSGSVDVPSSVPSTPPLGSYGVCVFGEVSFSTTGRYPLAAIVNTSTGSINLSLNQAKLSIGLEGSSRGNDSSYLLGTVCSGNVTGSAFVPTPLDPNYPASQALGYFTPSGLSVGTPIKGKVYKAQFGNFNTLTDSNGIISIDAAQNSDLTADVVLAPGKAYVLSITMPNMVGGSGNVVFEFAADFSWDERTA